MGARWLLVITGLGIVQMSGAQQNVAPPPATPSQALSSISGRVFGITANGDLKPARLAHIYLVYKGNAKSGNIDPDTAASTLRDASLTEKLRAIRDIGKMEREATQNNEEFNQNLSCRRELLAVDAALLATIEWLQQNKKVHQFLTADADEEGFFRITKVPTGQYTLLARGQAGANDASWSSEITLKPGSTISVKLSAPEKSCKISP